MLAPHNPNDDSVARRFMVIEISRRVREILRAPLRYESGKDGSGNEDGEALKAPRDGLQLHQMCRCSSQLPKHVLVR